MKKIKFTLKWKFTILTVIIMTIASGVLVTAINYDVNRRIPELTSIIIAETEVNPIANGDRINNFGLAENIEPYSYIYEYGDINPTYPDAIQGAVGITVSNIYTTSIIAFIIIIILGAFTTYFIVNRALKPVVRLNNNIKEINENNLTANLDVKGANDEIKELTISFNKMLAKLDNAFESQKRFNSSIAHELKTPLAVVKTNIDVLNSSHNKSIEEYEEILNVVEKSILKMNSMIETLLEIVRQENAPLNESVNVSNILDDAVEDLSVIADKNNISIDSEINEIEHEILGNEILLYRAFYNMIENSIKYNKVNGKVKVLCKKEKDNIEVVISDSGKGIEEEKLGKIFEPFYRCEGVNISSQNGVGLGLALTKSAIMIHGGTIEVKSNINEGSEFIIKLPLCILD
ncbi:HAMP domain-containing sensor histidine kinase [Clostridioides difficile]